MSTPGADETVEIEVPQPVTFTSGKVTDTVEGHLTRLKKAILKGINDGVNNFVADFINKIVAKETGTLRAALILEFRMGVMSVMRLLETTDTLLTFEVGIPDFPEYGEYHLDGTFGTAYAQPTTPGTRPTTMEELGNEIESYIDIAIRAELAAKGFDFT